jgi:uncharacterized repeat protein (TIGR03803 family)
MRSAKSLFFLVAMLTATPGLLTTAVPVFAASSEKVLHEFGKGQDGVWPYAGLIFDGAGKLYGTTTEGGTFGAGTVFQLTPGSDGHWIEKVLHNFQNNGKDGYWPFAGLVFDPAGNLYGTTTKGGALGFGTIFQMRPGASGQWSERVLHNFSGGKDGSKPYGSLIFDAAGNLYGTTSEGGGSGCYGVGCGTVFLLPSSSSNSKWILKVLHSFRDDGTDGHNPFAGVIFDAAGNLYGTTAYGPTSGYFNNGPGTVFQLTPGKNGRWIEKVLHTFSGPDGYDPYAGLIIDAADNLYGTTVYGGSSAADGNVFQLTPDGKGKWTESDLYDFCVARYNCNDGIYPYASVIRDASGNLYGTTYEGTNSGSDCAAYGCGTVFQLMPANGTWTEKILYSFHGEDGGLPYAGLISDSAGNLYGTTTGGGTYGNGTVFEITP